MQTVQAPTLLTRHQVLQSNQIPLLTGDPFGSKMKPSLILLLVVLFCFLLPGHSGQDLSETTRRNSGYQNDNTSSGCTYKGKVFPQGVFSPPGDKCSVCTCNAGGEVKCAAPACMPDPECIKYEDVPYQCCPKCVEYGCHYNGTTYTRGLKIPTGKCEKCYCPWEGGRKGKPVCVNMTCPQTPCVDAVKPKDRCCSICPKGPNCWLGNKTLSEGTSKELGHCHFCYCGGISTDKDPKQRQATCFLSKICLMVKPSIRPFKISRGILKPHL